LRHDITIGAGRPRHVVLSEHVATVRADSSGSSIYNFSDGQYHFGTVLEQDFIKKNVDPRSFLRKDQSILFHFRNSLDYPAISFLSERLREMRLYRDWTFGRDSQIRSPQPSGQADDHLAENICNLSLV